MRPSNDRPLDLSSLKRRALTTHNKSEVDKARDAELLEVIAALERAAGWLSEAVDEGCPCCGSDPFTEGPHFPDCALASFLAVFPPPGGEGA